MAKSKNASQHHNNRKDHRNGIHKVKRKYTQDMKGVDQKFKLNLKFSRKNKNPSNRQIKKLQARKDNWNLARGMPQEPIVLNRQVMERKALLATRQGRAKLLK
ncbi:hypothetical protein LOTGIDRAFT_174937 [Lottia gigantea]|uniref:60S ribosomal protein L29 n=1 Tax=Lottia gigantea TaxID=225164 RepID=V4ANA0_LOTGI|nr:hypothetical protein LOTGIDRAFT_174937 [Lottia gigantea]ESO96255.1 hypothetical protein LOTGIDRAFT_174937 [Lottia gigantea]